ncbi:MAG: hypothetical protein WC655_05760 [Candidatus Hydrogenedentales bacterium]
MTLPYTCTFKVADYSRAHLVEEVMALRFWGSPHSRYVRDILDEMSAGALAAIRDSLLDELDNHFEEAGL